MGQFSWLDCKDNNRQIVDDKYVNTYLLVPADFGGGHIEEKCYNGYGMFGGKDVYELVAEWNKDFIPTVIKLSEEGKWGCSVDKENLMHFYNGEEFEENYELRYVGICLACYDEDNERLPFPIKITHDKNAIYEDCSPSPSDPDQGWEWEDEDDWDDEEEW